LQGCLVHTQPTVHTPSPALQPPSPAAEPLAPRQAAQ
jgi:hypothetical protein